MSGLQKYYQSIQNYGGTNEAINNFVSSYQQKPLDAFNEKIADLKEQGRSLVEAGGAVEGLYAGAKGVQKSVQAWKAKY